MSKPKIFSLKSVSVDKVNFFLKKQFEPLKARFLIKHGEWLHKGNGNRFVLVLNDEIIGYSGIIPTQVYINGVTKPALWWIDLIISREFRKVGYQTIFDEFITKRPETKLGFPNKIAASIHAKHGWKIYNKIKVFKFPLKPNHIPELNKYGSFFPKLIYLIISFKLRRVINVKSKLIEKHNTPEFEQLINLHHQTKKKYFTTFKDEEFFKWRYLNSPFKKDYVFYILKKEERIHLTMIVRKIQKENGLNIRIVDFFGYLDDNDAILELLNKLISDSIKLGAIQITVFENDPNIKRLLFRNGFILFKKVRFCSFSKSHALNENTKIRWSISDSDNDFLD